MQEKTDRRCFLARGVLGVAGIGAACSSVEENTLLAAMQDGTAQPGTSATPAKPDIPPGSMPCGKIGKLSVSRLIIGGNLIGGWAHARDMMYASKLFKAYNTEAKIFETLELAQACGINTIQIDASAWDTVLKYNRERATKLQVIANPSFVADKRAMQERVKGLVDAGVAALYVHGGAGDQLVKNGQLDVIAQGLDIIKAEGVPAGVGCHSPAVVAACEHNKLAVDFYMKTFHSDNYWSATPKEQRPSWNVEVTSSELPAVHHDNMWCYNPEETAAQMEKVAKPWLAFKVMAAGAILPRVAFSYAFRNGADFVVAGMFDFQVETDAKIAIECVRKTSDRKRPWS
jgi:hypothetical protein